MSIFFSSATETIFLNKKRKPPHAEAGPLLLITYVFNVTFHISQTSPARGRNAARAPLGLFAGPPPQILLKATVFNVCLHTSRALPATRALFHRFNAF